MTNEQRQYIFDIVERLNIDELTASEANQEIEKYAFFQGIDMEDIDLYLERIELDCMFF